MAIYTIQIKTVCRSDGHSATAKIAYNCRDKIKDLRTNKTHRYNSKKKAADLLYSEIIYRDLVIDKKFRSEIWNNAEFAENRKESRTAREYVLALPKELSIQQNIELVREFAKYITCRYNNVADWAIHNEKNGNGNIHAHILTTTREFNPETLALGERTQIEWNNTKCKDNKVPYTPDQIKEIRKEWENIQNKHLARASFKITVSCARKKDRSLVKKHLGKDATALERKGVKTNIGNHNRIIDALNKKNQNIANHQQNISNLGEQIKLKTAEINALQQQINESEKARIASEAAELLQQKIASISTPSGNCITANNKINSLFTLTEAQRLIFKPREVGDYLYFANDDNSVEIHSKFIRCKYFDEADTINCRNLDFI